MDSHLTLVLSALTIAFASHRVTRLIVEDKIWSVTRVRLKAWLNEHGKPSGQVRIDPVSQAAHHCYTARNMIPAKLIVLLGCGQCVGVWVTLAFVGVWVYGGDVWQNATRVIAVIGVQSYLAVRG